MKYLPICLVFLLLIFCGGVASRVLFPVSLEGNLEKQSSRILEDAGVDADNDRFDHYFVALGGQIPANSTGRVVLEHIGGQVWGGTADVGSGKTIGPQSRFSARQTKGTVILEGEVSSEKTKKSLEAATRGAIGVRQVENAIKVNSKLPAILWSESLPVFLKDYLSYSGVSGLEVGPEGIKMEGVVLSREVREKLSGEAAKFVSAPAIVENSLSVRKSKNPTFKLQGTADGLKLSGLLPDEATRRKLIAAVREALPEKEFKDEIRVAPGVSNPWWLANAKSLIPVFLKETGGVGSVEYWKNRLHIHGKVGNEAVKKKLSTIPLGPQKPDDFSMHSNLSLRPEREPSVSISKDEKQRFVAQGSVGSSSVKNGILSALIQHDPDAVILDQVSVSHRVKDAGWVSPSKLIEAVVLNTEGGTVTLNSGTVAIEGEVNSASGKEKLVSLASSTIGAHGTVKDLITVKEVPVEAVAAVPENEPDLDFTEVAVYFRSGSFSLGGSDFEKLSKTAAMIQSLHPGTKLTVGGFADNRGNQAANEKLSGKRAAAVRDHLVSLGISKERLKIKTFGEDVSHVRQSDLWKSRRVELSIDRE
ncbi:MAG: OmpA family protein [Verrucomicrobiales bacterium]|nr:OmpA family protein [Verrucomicrobiales bacterium]